MIFDLDRSGPTPIYLKIKNWMREQIDSGVWPEHYKLMSEIDLAAELRVSRGTVRQATYELIKEGLLLRIHGRGTFVASKRLEQPLAERLIGFSEDLIEKGIPFETQVLEQAAIKPSGRVASLLSFPNEGKVLSLKRVRRVAKMSLILLHNYVVYDRCPGIEQVDFTRYRLFEVLEQHYGLVLDWGKRTFEAQAAGSEIARLLDLSPGDPVMNLEQIVFLNDGSPIELSNVWLRGDRFRLSAIVKRKKSGTASFVANEYALNEHS